ncbi:PIG-L family deacetylase [Pedobacter frigiditerrae]|uniref:PIG-L family deacetylase n=1 Tax=Pedobacter frigiditerrae TaxID=2530452 RepID=A0A4R0N150_9SPHI|nr:PIG-L family deacetylase [Pedobacter frigiditerrae]TCC93479.1 PIG-L family deacetylase [Pedobacter frigiditerrae]
MKRLIYLIAFLIFPAFLKAQMQQLNAAEIALGIAKLNVKGSVLYIAAHPDDENTRLLAYLAKEAKVRTGYLSLTRGDGGQNLIGNEQAELLGLIRTQELLAARRTDGAEQFFTRANDFGFSKTSDESFKIWGKEQILSDVVWVIRKFQPDVIITRFPEDARAGHGHHAGSAILAREAFVAAADKTRFPEQLKYVKVWQAKRILWNTFNFGGNNTTSPDQLKLDVGLYNPLLGKSYGEIAAISRTNHKSQGFGSTLQRGEAYEFFTPVAGEPAKTSIFDGIDLTIKDKAVELLLSEIKKEYNVAAPEAILPKLLQLKKLTDSKDFNHQLLNELILATAGFWTEAVTTENAYALGDSVKFSLNTIYRAKTSSPLTIKVDNVFALENNKMQSLSMSAKANAISQPYYLEKNHPIGSYIIDNQTDIGYPENPKPFALHRTVTINGTDISIDIPILYKNTNPVKGERYQPLVIAPAVTATMSEKAYIFSSNSPKTITVQLKNFRNNSTGFITPQLPKGWKSNPEKIDFNLTRKGDEQNISFSITPGGDINSGNITLQVNTDGKIDDKGLKIISYEHIPTITIFPQATARLEKIDLKIAGKKIGYLDGAGDLTADALKEMGYQVTNLNPAQVLTSDLSTFDAIVVGVRFYNINDDAKIVQPKLLAYVQNGGTLLIQYNVNNGLKYSNFGPYPFKLANKRVTEEDAKVNFINPKSAALNYPNKITEKDFDGWIQERGLYFATDIDPKYATVLSMKDTGETESDGSLLIADYGKGKFVYTSLVFFRELPAGVPGAYRLFANLLAPKQP